MGLSNYLPNSRISQSGVVPNEAARPASPYEGQVIYQQDTDRTLVWNGTAWVDVSTGKTGRSGLVLVYSQDFSAADPLDITGIFTSDFRNYKLFMDVRGSTTTYLNMQMFSGTNTLFNSALYFRYGNVYSTAGVTTNLYLATQTQYSFLNYTATNTERLTMEVTFFSPEVSGVRTHFLVTQFDGSNGNISNAQGLVNDTTQFTGLRFDANSGSITGSVRVYGYNQ